MKKINLKSSAGVAVFSIVILSLMFFTVGCVKKEEIKIGAILPLTGSAAPYGINAQRGIQLALEEVNNKGGINEKKVEVLFEDSKTDPKEAVAALQKIGQVNKIRFVIGDINSSGVLAMAPIAEH